MPKIVRKNQKKRAIALAAIELFYENGLVKTSVESIAKAAGVGKGTVYLYFHSKEEIITEIWDFVCEVLNETREKRYKEASTVAQKIAIFFDFSPLEENGLINKLIKIFGMNLSIILTTSHPALQDDYIKKTQNDVDQLRKLYQEGVYKGEFRDLDPEVIGAIFENMFNGSIINSMCKNEDITAMRKAFHIKRDILLELIRK